jgi:hypothetical protein
VYGSGSKKVVVRAELSWCELRDSILPEFPVQSPEYGVVSLADQRCGANSRFTQNFVP